ncbi:MAG: holo-ACP synthase [Elusimicrobiota bacterium]
MKIEVGVDIIEVERIKDLIDKNDSFSSRVFNDDEINYCNKHKRYAEHFAVRFAAKEAVIKALGKRDIPFKDITISHEDSGRPVVCLTNSWKKYESYLSVSLSHCEKYAVAYVVYCK